MNYITKLPPDHISTATRQLAGDKQGGVFYCSLCEEEFVFYHRSVPGPCSTNCHEITVPFLAITQIISTSEFVPICPTFKFRL